MLKYTVLLLILFGCAEIKTTEANKHDLAKYELVKDLFDRHEGLEKGFDWKPKVRELIGEPDIIEEMPSSLIIFKEIYLIDEESYFYIEGERHLQNRAMLSDIMYDLDEQEFHHYQVYGNREW